MSCGLVPAVTFTEMWYTPGDEIALAELARKAEGEGIIVEVGCWEGRSTVALANAVFPREVHAVDTWEGSPGEISGRLAKDRDVHKQFLANIDELTEGNVIPIRMGWRQYFKDRLTGPVRFCHIDGPHAYEEVRDNLLVVLPLMCDGGIICGDDVRHETVRKAVLEVLGDDVGLTGDKLWWFQKGRTRNVAEEYGHHLRRPSDIRDHLSYFYDLGTQSEKIIELGTRGGASTSAFLHGLAQTEDGHCWSVDLEPAPKFDTDRWTFIQGNDLDPDVYKALPDDADVLFIGTSHHYQQTLNELNLYRWKVKPGGIILLHDTELARPAGAHGQAYPVKRAMEKFCHDEGFTYTNNPACFGLGSIEV